jgi:hypothetical protein
LAGGARSATLADMTIRSRSASILSTVVLALAPIALAGPDIDESTPSKPDAGGTPASAKLAVGKNSDGGTVLVRCSGALATGLVSGDSVDMFVFNVWSTTEFVAEVNASVAYPTSIWLFRVATNPDQPNSPPAAFAVVGNNAAEAGSNASRIRFPGGGQQFPTGTYAIAITPRGVRPFGLSATGGQVPLFGPPPNPNGTGLMLPSVAGVQLRLSIWDGNGSAAGPYALAMGGSGFVPAGTGAAACGSQYAGSCFEPHPIEVGPGCNDPECCASVCAIDPSCCSGAWDNTCATIAGQNCTICTGGAPPSDCPGDINGDGWVNGLDLGLLLGDWGPCY